MKPRAAYNRAGALVADAVRDEILPPVLPGLDPIISGAAVMLSGAVAFNEFRWRRGGRYRELPDAVVAEVQDFVTIYGGSERDIFWAELLAIAVVGDSWKQIRRVARRLLEGQRVTDRYVRRIVGTKQKEFKNAG
jgi:hypothetical protein